MKSAELRPGYLVCFGAIRFQVICLTVEGHKHSGYKRLEIPGFTIFTFRYCSGKVFYL